MKLNDWSSRFSTLFVLLCSCCVQARGWDVGSSTKSSSGAYFIKRGSTYTVTSREALDLHDHLPPDTFTVGVTPSGEFFLQTIKPFEIKGKVYGNTHQRAERILQTFLDRNGSTGVLLTGEKGTGKTFLAKLVSILAARQSIPTVVVNQQLSGERFNAFVQSIQQPAVFLFDEFEKTFSDRESRRGLQGWHPDAGVVEMAGSSPFEIASQDAMLTLLDGTYPSKTLFLLTTNDMSKVSFQMRNRPGRIYYVIDFDGLSVEFIEKYCMDNLNDLAMLPKVIAISSFFETFSFDVLQAMVEEMNRYGETPEQVLFYLNARPEFGKGSRYTVQELSAKGKVIPKRFLYDREWSGNPLFGVVRISYRTPPDATDDLLDEDDDIADSEIQFLSSHIDGMDAAAGTFWYWNEEEQARLILERSARSAKQGRFSVNVDIIDKFPNANTRGKNSTTETTTEM